MSTYKNHSTRITVTTIHTTLPDEFTPLSKITSTQAIQKKFKRTKTLKGTTEKWKQFPVKQARRLTMIQAPSKHLLQDLQTSDVIIDNKNPKTRRKLIGHHHVGLARPVGAPGRLRRHFQQSRHHYPLSKTRSIH